MVFWNDRRTFLRNGILWASVISRRLNLPTLWGGNDAGTPPVTGAPPDVLEAGFISPPDWAKPWCYWWWLNGYATREGIVKDLDEMKKQGISGVLVFNASGGPTPKTTEFMSQEWRDLFRFAVEEASKRGIEVSLNLCSGWDAGGPWIAAEEAPQMLVFTAHQIRGPQRLAARLSEPKHDDSYYQDIVVLAYRLDTVAVSPSEFSLLTNPSEYLSYYYSGAPERGNTQRTRFVCHSNSVTDLSKMMEPDGQLKWDVPEGEWLILRFGHTVKMPLTQAYIKECGPQDRGYEVDPLRAEVMDKHFAATAGKVLKDVPSWAGKTLKYFHIDSWELGKPNWTAAFPREFQRRRGYEIWPYMAALAGKIVDNPIITARFMEDFDRTLGDLTVENYYGRLAELSHQHGIGTHPESEGPEKPCEDSLLALGTGDVMMAEYWSRITEPDGYIWYRTPADLRWMDGVKGASSAAHIYGREIVQAEAFTELFSVDWSHYPFALKDIGDRAFCSGLNRNVLCFYVHQPELDTIPGYAWPRCGLKINRNVTWWPLCHTWLRYLSRCQFMFRRGRFVADVCYFYGEEVPNYVPAKECMVPPLPKGYDCDSINAEALVNRMMVDKGHLRLPGGISYRILVLPHRPWTMQPDPQCCLDDNRYPGPGNGLPMGISARVLRKVKQLVENGATILGPKPVRAPGLSGYPECDNEVRQLADDLWGETNGQISGERKIGQGRVLWGRRIEDIFENDGVLPDFRFRSNQPYVNLDYIHYSAGSDEIYFISNQSLRYERVECQFRVESKQPELWDSVTGEIRKLPEFRSQHGQTVVPLEFAARQSFFVVFRKPAPAATPSPRRGRNFPKIDEILEIKGPWEVSFDPRWGGPERVIFDRLEDWTERHEEGVRYYSGMATYRNSFDCVAAVSGKRLFLDLGVVHYLAEVHLNGMDLGVVWTAPWRVEITEAIRPRGNTLEIRVVNLWTNRLLGDVQQPPSKRLTKTNVIPDPSWPLLPSGLLGPVTVQAIGRFG
jgi:hypothetical protein